MSPTLGCRLISWTRSYGGRVRALELEGGSRAETLVENQIMVHEVRDHPFPHDLKKETIDSLAFLASWRENRSSSTLNTTE